MTKVLLFTLAITLIPLLSSAEPPLVQTVDRVEINSVYEEEGKLIFDQIIFWDWDDSASRYQVVDWRLIKDGRREYDSDEELRESKFKYRERYSYILARDALKKKKRYLDIKNKQAEYEQYTINEKKYIEWYRKNHVSSDDILPFVKPWVGSKVFRVRRDQNRHYIEFDDHKDKNNRKRIYVRLGVYHTHTTKDIEVEEREHLPQNKRRGLISDNRPKEDESVSIILPKELIGG